MYIYYLFKKTNLNQNQWALASFLLLMPPWRPRCLLSNLYGANPGCRRRTRQRLLLALAPSTCPAGFPPCLTGIYKTVRSERLQRNLQLGRSLPGAPSGPMGPGVQLTGHAFALAGTHTHQSPLRPGSQGAWHVSPTCTSLMRKDSWQRRQEPGWTLSIPMAPLDLLSLAVGVT